MAAMLPALLARARTSGFLAQRVPQCCGQLEASFARMRLSTQGSDNPAGSTAEGEEAKPSSASSWREWADSQLDSARQGERPAGQRCMLGSGPAAGRGRAT